MMIVHSWKNRLRGSRSSDSALQDSIQNDGDDRRRIMLEDEKAKEDINSLHLLIKGRQRVNVTKRDIRLAGALQMALGQFNVWLGDIKRDDA
jgi:hypothetical protein